MDNTYHLKSITSIFEIQQCWEVAFLLRPHLNHENWSSTILEMIQNEKYSIVAIVDQDKVIAFAGYRMMTSLHSGNMIYIDDLCTLQSYRGKGLATQLLNHVNSIAVATNKDAVVLDTGLDNNIAQKLYLNNRFKLVAFHLAYRLN